MEIQRVGKAVGSYLEKPLLRATKEDFAHLFEDAALISDAFESRLAKLGIKDKITAQVLEENCKKDTFTKAGNLTAKASDRLLKFAELFPPKTTMGDVLEMLRPKLPNIQPKTAAEKISNNIADEFKSLSDVVTKDEARNRRHRITMEDFEPQEMN